MSTWITPEEMERKRKRNRTLLYISLPALVILGSAAITILANQI
ncbi:MULTISPECIES: hypothetical protein [unclassified Bacillus (in: firmicutes)]|nr:hypothetical protein [Bacillus sp. HNG]